MIKKWQTAWSSRCSYTDSYRAFFISLLHFIFFIDYSLFCLLVSFLLLPNQAVRLASRPLETKLGTRWRNKKPVLDLRKHPFLSSDFLAQGILFIYQINFNFFFCESKEKHSSARLRHRNRDGHKQDLELETGTCWTFVLRCCGAARCTTQAHKGTHSQWRSSQ